MKHKRSRVCISLLVSAALLWGLWTISGSHSKTAAFRYVKKHTSELTAYAQQIITERPLKELQYNSWTVNYYPSAPDAPAAEIVEFAVSGRGFGASTSHAGFYYSPEDVPLGFQGALLPLTETVNGWTWQEENGDDHQTIEKLCDHWYWYEAHF